MLHGRAVGCSPRGGRKGGACIQVDTLVASRHHKQHARLLNLPEAVLYSSCGGKGRRRCQVLSKWAPGDLPSVWARVCALPLAPVAVRP